MASSRRGCTSTRSWPNTPRASSPSDSAGIARGVEFWVQIDARHHRLEGVEQSVDVLVGHRPDHTDQRARSERLLHRLRTRPGTVRVVRGVEHDGGRPAHDLEPPRRRDLRERLAHHLQVETAVESRPPGERLDGRDRARRVVRLVRAVQREEDFLVRRSESLERDHLAAEARRPLGDAELEPLAGHRRADLGRVTQQDLGRLDRLLREDAERARLDDPRLLDRDRSGVSPR